MQGAAILLDEAGLQPPPARDVAHLSQRRQIAAKAASFVFSDAFPPNNVTDAL